MFRQAYHAPRSDPLKRPPPDRGWQYAAITTDDIGLPITHSSRGRRCRMPNSVDIRSFVHDSSSMIAFKSSGPAIASRMPTDGYRLGTRRAVLRNRAFVTGATISATPPIQEAPHLVESIDPSFHDECKGRPAPKQWICVRQMQPAVSQRIIGIQNMQSLVDAKQQRDPRQHVVGKRSDFASLVLVVRGWSRPSQKGSLLRDVQSPRLCEIEECPDCRCRQ